MGMHLTNAFAPLRCVVDDNEKLKPIPKEKVECIVKTGKMAAALGRTAAEPSSRDRRSDTGQSIEGRPSLGSQSRSARSETTRHQREGIPPVASEGRSDGAGR